MDTVRYENITASNFDGLERDTFENIFCIEMENTSTRIHDVWDKVKVFLEYVSAERDAAVEPKPEPIRSITIRNLGIKRGDSFIVPMELRPTDWQDPVIPGKRVSLSIFLCGIQDNVIVFESLYPVSSLVSIGSIKINNNHIVDLKSAR